MNLPPADPNPWILLTSTPKPSQCASDLQMFQRNSILFRSNVAVNVSVEVATLVCSTWLFVVLQKRNFFSKSFTFLLYPTLLVVNLHQFNYGCIQLWSLIRALTYFDQPCSIMFTEYECFPWYTMSIFSRLLLLFMSCALTADNLISFLAPRVSGYTTAIVSLVVAVLASTVMCKLMTADGPNNNIQANCFQRLNRDIHELKVQLNMYLIVVGVCAGLNALLWGAKIFQANKRTNYDLTSRSAQKEDINTAGATSVIVLAQMVCSVAYTVSVIYLIDHGKDFETRYVGLYVLWFYTYTYSGLFLPLGILIFTQIILRRRRSQVKMMTGESGNRQQVTDEHFSKLGLEWDRAFEAQITPVEG